MTVAIEGPPALASLRRDIEEIDRAIVGLVAARLEVAGAAIRLRCDRGEEVTNRIQEGRVLARARRWAIECDIPPALAESILRSILRAGKARFLRTASHAPAVGTVDRRGRPRPVEA